MHRLKIAQVLPRYGALVDLSELPKLSAWASSMAALPHHDAVFAVLDTLGDLKDGARDAKGEPLPPILSRLVPATKAGLKAIEAAAVAK